MTLRARILTPRNLTAASRDQMYALMTRHYDNVWREQFEADLSEKEWVIWLTDDTGTLCGFSTQRLLPLTLDDRAVSVVFSGDTIVAREHWGTTALPIAWGRLGFSIIDQHPERELYWYLASKGFRTYRFLPLFFNEFYPRYDCATPRQIRAVIDAVGFARYGDRYDPGAGVIRAARTSDRLRPELGDGSRRSDPHIEFFDRANAGHAAGDELCCVAPLTRENFSASARRLIKSQRFGLQAVG